MNYDRISILRYMGNKNRLLDFIIPAIAEVSAEGEAVCDLLAGTHSVGYALKRRNRIIANDIQEYSGVIGKAIIENNGETISSAEAARELYGAYAENLQRCVYCFFYDHYADTYFSPEQCLVIDSVRYAIETVGNSYRQALYLCALMHAMCKIQSTPGHFAQFMPKDHRRIQPLREMDVWREFLCICDDFRSVVNNNMKNEVFQSDYKQLLGRLNDNIACYYVDPPYSGEQYSRFYHILETAVKYDEPELRYKALYRTDRFMSGFCYKNSVESEFEFIMRKVREKEAALVISYSENGVMPAERLEQLARKYFRDVELRRYNYAHSTQGKGKNEVNELLLIMQK